MKLNLLNVTSTEFDADLVPHFVRHYMQYDIDEWHVILHRNCDVEPHNARKFYRNVNPAIKFYEWNDMFLSTEKIKKFNSIISGLEGYVLLADVDELQIWTQEPKDILKRKPVVGGVLKDRLPMGSLTKKVEWNPSLFEQYPISSTISKEAFQMYTHKPCAFHSTYRLVNSHDLTLYEEPVYYMDNNMIDIAHFRWTDTREEKAEKRFVDYKKANEEGAALNWRESKDILKYLDND